VWALGRRDQYLWELDFWDRDLKPRELELWKLELWDWELDLRDLDVWEQPVQQMRWHPPVAQSPQAAQIT
jgi:hypothetical protein